MNGAEPTCQNSHEKFGAFLARRGQQHAELLGQVHQDRAGFEHAERLRAAAVDQGRNLGVGVDIDEAGGELVTLEDLDQPGIVFGVAEAQRQQFLQHDRGLLAVGRTQRIDLEGMLADRQFLVVRRAGDRTVHAGEGAAVLLVPGPDFRRNVFFRHGRLLRGYC